MSLFHTYSQIILNRFTLLHVPDDIINIRELCVCGGGWGGGWWGGYLGEAKVSCILCHRAIQLILAYSWARLAKAYVIVSWDVGETPRHPHPTPTNKGGAVEFDFEELFHRLALNKYRHWFVFKHSPSPIEKPSLIGALFLEVLRCTKKKVPASESVKTREQQN